MATKQSVWGGWSGVATGVRRSRVPLVIFVLRKIIYTYNKCVHLNTKWTFQIYVFFLKLFEISLWNKNHFCELHKPWLLNLKQHI
jgi:hypothetical protein